MKEFRTALKTHGGKIMFGGIAICSIESELGHKLTEEFNLENEDVAVSVVLTNDPEKDIQTKYHITAGMSDGIKHVSQLLLQMAQEHFMAGQDNIAKLARDWSKKFERESIAFRCKAEADRKKDLQPPEEDPGDADHPDNFPKTVSRSDLKIEDLIDDTKKFGA